METRLYAGPADLRAMQGLVQEAWRLVGPTNERHVGDVAWGAFQHVGREPEWERRLWFDAYMTRDLGEIEDPEPPAKFALRTVTEADVQSRVEAHRSAFHPSRFTLESYGNVRRAAHLLRHRRCSIALPRSVELVE